MLCNLTTRFARGTEDTEENYSFPGGQKKNVLCALCVSVVNRVLKLHWTML